MQKLNDTKIEIAELAPSLPVQENICQSRSDRDKLRAMIQTYVSQEKLIGPLTLDELARHASQVLSLAGLNERYRDYAAILVHNEVWTTKVSEIPYSRRLLLLPRCLRNQERCQAHEDSIGLICAHCGNCAIHDLQTAAEQLGYMVIVAEGSPVVMALIESGRIETVIGVSCQAVLEKVFPYMEAAAVPGIAIPLLRDGCEDTYVDMDWIWEAIYLNAENPIPRMDLNVLKKEVRDCFEYKTLQSFMGAPRSETEEIALQWLSKSGKRWRPFLAACVFQSLREDASAPLPDSIFKLLIAIECFHKASLIHDDIEDEDTLRYGEKTVHAQHGIAIALNVGDILVGDGYRLIGELEIQDDRKVKMLQIAALGHRTLCMGQGAELCWQQHRTPLSTDDILAIYKQKTAPAFEVSLRLGAMFAGADEKLGDTLQRYSSALGIAYQIKDDLSDSGLESGRRLKNHNSMDLSLLMAMAYKKANQADREILELFWQKTVSENNVAEQVFRVTKNLDVVSDILNLFLHYKNQAIAALSQIDNANLKCVLHRVVGKIFCDIAKMGCCNDYQVGNAPDRETRR